MWTQAVKNRILNKAKLFLIRLIRLHDLSAAYLILSYSVTKIINSCTKNAETECMLMQSALIVVQIYLSLAFTVDLCIC